MRGSKKVLSVLLFLFFSLSVFALEPGDKAPQLNIATWLKNGPVTLNTKDQNKIYVIFFFATWSNSTSNVFRFVSNQVETFRDSNVEFIGITPENPDIVSRFLKNKSNLNVNFALAIDDHSKTYNEYMEGEQGVPIFFIFAKNKELLWKGGPVEENGALLHILGGTFNMEMQKKVEEYHKSMMQATQSFNFDEQIEYAQKVLKIDPTDRMAVDAMIDYYIKNDQLDKCLDFVKETRKKAGSNKYIQYFLYLTELNIARGIVTDASKKYIHDLSENYMKSFQNTPAALNSFAIKLMVNIPPEITSLENAFLMSQKAVKLQRDLNNKPRLGIFLQTLARGYYLIGDFKNAIKFQEEAIPLLVNKEDKARAVLTKQYYDNALSLNKSKNLT